MRLVEYLQDHLQDVPLGGSPSAASTRDTDATYDDLKRVQLTNEKYFKAYWCTLIAAFIATVAVALVFREEVGGLGAVLGVGGVVQGGLVLRLSAEWKEKARLDIVAVLTRRLSADQLQIILKDILADLRK